MHNENKVQTVPIDSFESTLLNYKNDKGALIILLQKAQEIDGYVTEEVIHKVSDAINVPISEVYGVITFYSQFRLTPLGKYVIRICEGTACHVNGGSAIIRVIIAELGIEFGETTSDGLFSLESVACIGCCSLAPVIMINDNTHGNLTPESARKVLSSYRKIAAEKEA